MLKIIGEDEFIATEALADGISRIEQEYVYYAKVIDPNFISKATSWEDQEQWEIRLNEADPVTKCRMRVRHTVLPTNEEDYVLTLKSRRASVKSSVSVETEVPATQDMFLQLKMISPKGMCKRRYRFGVPKTLLEWEVDMFYVVPDLAAHKHGSDRSFHPWVKIDLEVKTSLDKIPAFPAGLEVYTLKQYGERSTEEEAFVRSLYDRYFLATN